MQWRYALVLVALIAPGAVQAQEKLDELLPAGSQIYLRWDGVDAHKADAEKLAVVKMWKGETGKFLRSLWKYIEEVGTQSLSNELGAEMSGAIFDEFGGLIKSVGNKGFTMGFQLQGVDPFRMQLTMGFPHGAGSAKSPLSFLNTVARLDKDAKVKTVKHGKRQVQYVHFEPMYLAWWAEGKHAVWSFGTTEPGALLKELDGRKQTLTASALYKSVDGFNDFPAWMRGFVDLPGALAVAGRGQPIVNRLAESLGIDSVKSVTFFSGFDGPAERAVTLTNLAKGPRKGIARLFAGNKKFSLKDLPPMPEDVDGFSAGGIDWQAAYEVSVDFGDTLVKMLAPFGAPDIKQSIKNFEQNANVDVAATLRSLDELTVTYSAPAEGIFGTGQVQLVKVNDEKKLTQDLSKLLDAARNAAGGAVSVDRTKYHTAVIYKMGFSEPNNQIELGRIYFTVYKGWLAVSRYPQPLMGFILRSKGDLPVWKANADLQARLKPFPTEFAAIAVSDPRPTVKMILSALPTLMDAGNMLLQQAQAGAFPGRPKLAIKGFDMMNVPNAYEATRHLFPNVTVTTVDGDTIRSETRSSLLLGF